MAPLPLTLFVSSSTGMWSIDNQVGDKEKEEEEGGQQQEKEQEEDQEVVFEDQTGRFLDMQICCFSAVVFSYSP